MAFGIEILPDHLSKDPLYVTVFDNNFGISQSLIYTILSVGRSTVSSTSNIHIIGITAVLIIRNLNSSKM